MFTVGFHNLGFKYVFIIYPFFSDNCFNDFIAIDMAMKKHLKTNHFQVFFGQNVFSICMAISSPNPPWPPWQWGLSKVQWSTQEMHSLVWPPFHIACFVEVMCELRMSLNWFQYDGCSTIYDTILHLFWPPSKCPVSARFANIKLPV